MIIIIISELSRSFLQLMRPMTGLPTLCKGGTVALPAAHLDRRACVVEHHAIVSINAVPFLRSDIMIILMCS